MPAVIHFQRFLFLLAGCLMLAMLSNCSIHPRNQMAGQSEAIIATQQQVARLERLNKISTRDAADIHNHLVFARSIAINPQGEFDFSLYCAESLTNLECIDSVLALAEAKLLEAQE